MVFLFGGAEFQTSLRNSFLSSFEMKAYSEMLGASFHLSMHCKNINK